MPSPEDVHADLEGDRRSREGELRLIESLIATVSSEDEKTMLRRSLVLLTYSHLEGFCKFSLLAYTAALNELNIKCADATYPLAAAGLTKVFAALREPNSKHEYFKKMFPDDSPLHLAAREQTFIEDYETISKEPLQIPDKIVDLKSNLSADILRKMLYRLGFSYPAVDPHASNIEKLRGMRNAIAHGDRLKIPKEAAVKDYVSTALDVMRFLQGEVYDALRHRTYLRPVPGPPVASPPAS